ncbi:MAG TPA: SDR family oxidoreductase [Pirellulales bacterium]|jgi:NAD(P)-dependent dehydrogenase (short-subunit alcohol dehydrogenase family)|nr:SDR family oxidoreductase [Pirellulales bacterium]
MGKLDGKVALVTGASRGLGRAIARGLAGEGASLVMAARHADQLHDAEQELARQGADALTVPADVTDEIQVEKLFGRAIERFGRLDLLVNNAGAFDGGPIDELSTADWDKVIAVNLRAPFLCTRAAMRIMQGQGAGRIINIGSISAQRVRPGSAPYSASKHGLWGLTQVTALEGREHGITCGCLHPGNIRVERRQTSRAEDAEPMMSVDEVAEVVVLMAVLPPHVEMLEAIVLPSRQLYVGRG